MSNTAKASSDLLTGKTCQEKTWLDYFIGQLAEVRADKNKAELLALFATAACP